MTVAELIEKLEEFDKELPVGIFVDGYREGVGFVTLEDDDGLFVEIC